MKNATFLRLYAEVNNIRQKYQNDSSTMPYEFAVLYGKAIACYEMNLITAEELQVIDTETYDRLLTID